MSRVVVTSRSFSRHPQLRGELLARYPATTFNDEGRSLAGADLVAFLRGHDKAITALERLDDAIFAAVPELKVIAKYGVGLDMIDMTAMRRHNVQLGWTGGVNRRSVSELVIAFAIALLRRVPQANTELRAGTWRQNIGRQLSDRTVGIVGCGHVGKDLVRLLRAFGCKILVNDIRDDPAFDREHGITRVTLEELLSRADVVTLHIPLDDSTQGLLGPDRLKLLRPDAILINAARGQIVDEAALAAMLRDGRLAGAAFDVFATEPPMDIELMRLPNFLATPHIGGSAEEAILAMGRSAIKGLDEHKVPAPGDECWPAGPTR